ncbi:MAG: hypothetical protein U0R65_09875 [Candidatus Nanopelagicales bacterium]
MPWSASVAATVAQVAACASGPQHVAVLAERGIGRQRVRTAVGAGALTVLRRGIVVPTDAWRTAEIADRRRWAVEAALLAFPAGCASHDSAARLHGLPEFRMHADDADAIPSTHITRVGAARVDDWLTVHGCDTPPEWIHTAGGLRMTDLVRTSIETAAGRSLRGALVVIDAAMRLAAAEHAGSSAVRAAVIDPAVVGALRVRWRYAVGAYAGHRWVTTVRQAVELADPAAESVLESLSRAAMIENAVPQPRCGVPLVGDDGRTYWVDFCWDRFGLIGEADGLAKYDDPSAHLREKHRQEALRARGWEFVRWGFAHVFPDPTVMLSRVRHALRQPPTRLGWLP